MNISMQKALALVVVVIVAGCQSPVVGTAQDTCSVAPPADVKSNPKAAAEAAADLTKFAKLPLSANFKLELSNTFSATFQKVPDVVAACAMLNQTYACIRDAERAKSYLDFMRETKQCTKS